MNGREMVRKIVEEVKSLPGFENSYLEDTALAIKHRINPGDVKELQEI